MVSVLLLKSSGSTSKIRYDRMLCIDAVFNSVRIIYTRTSRTIGKGCSKQSLDNLFVDFSRSFPLRFFVPFLLNLFRL